MKKRDRLAEALGNLPAPPLDAAFGERVGKLAAATLEPAPAESPAPLRLVLTGALVPGLLLSAAAVRAVETVKVAKEVYGATDADDGDHGEG